MVVAAVDPTAAVAVVALTVEVVVALTAAVEAAPTVAVVVTNPDILQTSQSPLRLTRSGLFLLSPCISCPFKNLSVKCHNSPPPIVLNIMTQEV
jgi:hypothetical protein